MTVPETARGATRGEGLLASITAATLAKLILNIGHRMVYPFLPVIARGLGVSIQSAGLLVTVRSAVGAVSPLFGPLSDRLGRRLMMALGLLTLAGGATVIAAIPLYWAAFAGFLLLGLAKVIFDPSLHAYLGDRVPYRRRGRFVAATELSWAGAILIGAPAMGLVIERWGWQAPFWLLIALALTAVLGLLLLLPATDRTGDDRSTLPSFRSGFHLVLGNRAAAAALAVGFLISGANELLFIVYGPWMETSFGLSVSRLGLATATIGGAELLGEIGMGALTDRLGKRRSVAAGLALTAGGYVALPLWSADLASALTSLFLVFVVFEFSIIAIIPLVTELVPAARGTMMALNVAALSIGRAAGASLGTRLWPVGGLLGNGFAAGGATFLAFAILVAFVHEG